MPGKQLGQRFDFLLTAPGRGIGDVTAIFFKFFKVHQVTSLQGELEYRYEQNAVKENHYQHLNLEIGNNTSVSVNGM